MAMGGLLAGTTVGLMLASTPISTLQLTPTDALATSEAVTSTAALTSRLPWSLDFEYDSVRSPANELAVSFAGTAATHSSHAQGDGVDPDDADVIAQRALQAANADVATSKPYFAPARFGGTDAIAYATSAPRGVTTRQTRSNVGARSPNAPSAMAAAPQSELLDALFAPQKEWSALSDDGGVAYSDASFSFVASSSKEPALVRPVELADAAIAVASTNVPTPGTLALFALGIAAVIVGARGLPASTGLLRR